MPKRANVRALLLLTSLSCALKFHSLTSKYSRRHFQFQHAQRSGMERQLYLTDGGLTVGRDMSLFHPNI